MDVQCRLREVYVCDANNHRVQVFTLAGEFLRAWDIPPQSNSHPTAMSVAPWGDVYIAQSNSAYVSRFDPDGKKPSSRMWGGKTADCQIRDVATSDIEVFVLTGDLRVYSQDGVFLRDWGVPRDSQSLCVGSDQCVYVITPAICLVFDLFGKQKAAWGGFKGAKKVTIHGSELYVTEGDGVRVFQPDGIFLRALGHSKTPRAVAVHAKKAYICESHSIEIVEISP